MSDNSVSTIGLVSAAEVVRQNNGFQFPNVWQQEQLEQGHENAHFHDTSIVDSKPLASSATTRQSSLTTPVEGYGINQSGYPDQGLLPRHSSGKPRQIDPDINNYGRSSVAFQGEASFPFATRGQPRKQHWTSGHSDTRKVNARATSQQGRIQQGDNNQKPHASARPASLGKSSPDSGHRSHDSEVHALVVQYMISAGASPAVAEHMATQFEEQQKRGMDVFASVAASSEPPNGKMSHDLDKYAIFADDDDEGSVASTIMLALAQGAARAAHERNENYSNHNSTWETPLTASVPHNSGDGTYYTSNEPLDDPNKSTRALLIQYLLSIGTDPFVAEQMASQFNEQQVSSLIDPRSQHLGGHIHPTFGSDGTHTQHQTEAMQSFHNKHMEALNGGYRRRLSAPAPFNITVAALGQGPMNYTARTQSLERHPQWSRAERPGAVEMDGRAFGAPRRPDDHQDFADVQDLEMELEIAANPHILEAIPVNHGDVVYAESATYGIKSMLKERSVRRMLALICIAIVGATIGVTVIALRGTQARSDSKSSEYASLTQAPTESPSSSPTLIDDGIENAAAAISGYEIVLTEGSPQRQAVSWMSTWDKFDTQGLELIFFQRYIMTVFYFALNGEQWLDQEKWLSPTLHTCDWSFGIICSTDQTRRQIVTGIDLSRNGIRGNIPSEISQMDGLTTLRLAKNTINGTIPTSLSDLTTLTLIDLSANELTGSIPSGIGNLQDLLILDLFENLLTGTIPPSTYTLAHLTKLDLSKNKLTGFLSQNVTNLDSLNTLSIQHNQLTGRMPSFRGMHNLESIFLDYNQLTGPFPDTVAELVVRLDFSISHNRISGNIPGISKSNFSEFINIVYKIQQVDISYNQMTGTVPSTIALVPTFRYLDMSGNQFTGIMPGQAKFGDFKSLEYFGAASNQFTGAVPVGFSDALTSLEVSNNHLTKGVPLELYNKFPHLEFLSLSNNNLGGRLSGLIGKLKALRDLRISNCSLTGVLPEYLNDASSLEYLTLDNNLIKGSIPTSAGSLSLLKALELDNNKLTGTLPSELGSISLLKVLNVANNSLTGVLPSTLQYLGELIEFDVSGNYFTGEVPQGLCDTLDVTATMVGCDLKCNCCSKNGTLVCNGS